MILNAATDREDRLIHADDALGALNERAGGRLGVSLAVPQLAAISRLARRLRIPVSRSLTIADGEVDVDCWAKATPNTEGVLLAVSLLRERPAWRTPATALIAADVAPPPGAEWTWEVDAQLRITRVAPEAGARYGFNAPAALASPLTRLFALEPSADGSLGLMEAMADRRDFDGQPALIRGTRQRVLLAGSVQLDASGGFAGFVGGTFPDPDGAQGPAYPSDLSQGFNARLDRVLRGPLARIIADADEINGGGDGPLDPHYSDYAADIASAGRHLLGLVDDLVDLEAIERDDFTTAREQFDLADVARRATALLSVRAADAGVTIDRSDFARPLLTLGESRRALQIMVNLIGNALRYAPRGTVVRLLLHRDINRAVAIVADDGKGIPAEDHVRIFDKFERVDAGEPGGSGLGLYIARRLARAMDGELTVDSAPGEGARFTLFLPAG